MGTKAVVLVQHGKKGASPISSPAFGVPELNIHLLRGLLLGPERLRFALCPFPQTSIAFVLVNFYIPSGWRVGPFTRVQRKTPLNHASGTPELLPPALPHRV